MSVGEALPGLRTIFFGTPALAVPTLDALHASGRHRPSLVVSQPSRPVGRGRTVRDPPVVRRARALELPIEQPETVRDVGFLDRLRALEPDVAVVVAFGQIFRKSLLALPRHGCLNLHASLLPRWRGAGPIQAAVAAGDETTGVTIMRMTRGLDAGPILLADEMAIEPHETAAELGPRLAERGAELMVEALDRLAAGELVEVEQDPEGVTLAPMLGREDGEVDWRLGAARLYDLWRAYQPWPGLTSRLGDRAVKLVEVALEDGAVELGQAPGTILGEAGDALRVACGGGTILRLLRLQRPGKRPVSGVDFRRGERLESGARFGA
ncbi:MAG: methionyl-tRNA formyltransferase [Acidobacteriota bacterium]